MFDLHIGHCTRLMSLCTYRIGWHTQRMDVDEGSEENLELWFHWIRQYGRLLEDFAHVRKLPTSHVLAYISR